MPGLRSACITPSRLVYRIHPFRRSSPRCLSAKCMLDLRPLTGYKSHMAPSPHFTLNPFAFSISKPHVSISCATHNPDIDPHDGAIYIIAPLDCAAPLFTGSLFTFFLSTSPIRNHHAPAILCDVPAAIQQHKCDTDVMQSDTLRAVPETRAWPHLQREVEKQPARGPAEQRKCHAK
jgi:hypothetical protein